MPALIFLLLFSYPVYAQTTLSGTVKDTDTGKTMPGVNVYLSGTSIGDASNAEGNYQFEAPEKGVFNLVFSFVGYHKKVIRLDLSSKSEIRHNILLKVQTGKLAEIKVAGSNKKWRKNLKLFRYAIIGQTSFAKLTTIENPYIIDFRDGPNNQLVASAREPILISNNALGYKIHVDLAKFEWSKHRDTGYYKVYLKYSSLTPRSSQEELEWWKNRIKTSMGSLKQFLEALYHDRLKNTAFSLKRSYNLSPLNDKEARNKLLQRGFSLSDISNSKKYRGFKLKDKLFVNYKTRLHYDFHGHPMTIKIKKKSAISSNLNDKTFFVDGEGNILNPLSLVTYRDWGENRLANSLPANYAIGDE